MNEIEEAHAGAPLCEIASRHLSACASCREFHAERAALRGLLRELEVVPAPPDFDFRVRARLAAKENADGRRVLSGAFAPGFLSISLAACFALTLGIALFFKQAPQGEYPTLSASSDVEAHRTSRGVQSFNNTREATDDSLVRIKTRRSSHETVARIPRRARTGAASIPPATTDGSGGASVVSNSIGVQGAPRYTSFAENSVADDDIITVPVNLSANALELSARDDQGEPRKMSLQSISFGAQELVNPVGDARRKLAPPTEGAW